MVYSILWLYPYLLTVSAGSLPPITKEEWEREFERYKMFPEWQQRQSMVRHVVRVLICAIHLWWCRRKLVMCSCTPALASLSVCDFVISSFILKHYGNHIVYSTKDSNVCPTIDLSLCLSLRVAARYVTSCLGNTASPTSMYVCACNSTFYFTYLYVCVYIYVCLCVPLCISV